MQGTEELEQMDPLTAPSGKSHRRRGRKRLRFEAPSAMPPGVRELWGSAPSEAQQKAHRTCVEILSLWLGRKRREEVASALSIPPLRVWQLSQQALSGMLAGLLKQPRTRCRQEVSMGSSEDDPRLLKQEDREAGTAIAGTGGPDPALGRAAQAGEPSAAGAQAVAPGGEKSPQDDGPGRNR